MTSILIRDMDPADVDRLKARAKQHGRSMAAEAREILKEHLERDARSESWWAWAEDFRRRQNRSFPDSAAFFHEARERGYRDIDDL